MNKLQRLATQRHLDLPFLSSTPGGATCNITKRRAAEMINILMAGGSLTDEYILNVILEGQQEVYADLFISTN